MKTTNVKFPISDNVNVAFNIKNIDGRIVTYISGVTKFPEAFRGDGPLRYLGLDDDTPLPGEEWQLDRADKAMVEDDAHIRSIKFYPSHIEVFTSKGMMPFDFTGFDDENEAFDAWEDWCDENADIDPLSRQQFERVIKNYFLLIYTY